MADTPSYRDPPPEGDKPSAPIEPFEEPFKGEIPTDPPDPPIPEPQTRLPLQRLFGRRFAEWYRDVKIVWKIVVGVFAVLASLVAIVNFVGKNFDEHTTYAFKEWWHDLGRDKIVATDYELRESRYIYSLDRLDDDRLATRDEAEESTYDLRILHFWGEGEQYCDEPERGSFKKWKKVWPWWQKEADQGGYVDAQNTLGVLYWCGLGVDEDGKRIEKRDEYNARKQWRNADSQKSKYARHNLAVAHWQENKKLKAEGKQSTKQFKDNKSKAIDYWKESVKQNLAEAQYNLANVYWDRVGTSEETPQDVGEAIKLYKEASKQGHLQSRFYLGRAHMLGRGVETHKEKAVDLWEEVAVALPDFALAKYNLAVAHAKDEGVANKDLEQAKILLEKVVGSKASPDDSNNYAHVHFMLGNLYFPAPGNKFSKLASSIGLLGLLEYFGYNEERYEEIKWRYKKADGKGYAPAQYYLAFLYWDRKIEPANSDNSKTKAITLLKKAAGEELPGYSSNHCLAQHALGLAYWWGEGVEENRDKAHALLKKASEQGLAESHYYLARYHYDKYQEEEFDTSVSDKSALENLKNAYRYYLVSYNLGSEQKHAQEQSRSIQIILEDEGVGRKKIKVGTEEIGAIKEEGENLAGDIKKMKIENCYKIRK